MRTIIVYLAIAALLMCPYVCAAKLAGAGSLGNEDQVACCQTCRARELSQTQNSSGQRSPGDRDPAQPRPSEDGKSCLCEGAVFDSTTRSPADAVLEFSLLARVADMATTPSLAPFAPSVDRAGPPLNKDGGRLTRIAIRSLLL
ncbi:MAG: hypothetical protein WD872_19850 [Pirellulaceae bacterium]